MKRKILAIFSVVCMLFAVGCSKPATGSSAGDSVQQADPSQKAEIEFYVWSEKELCEEVAASFKELYPNWTVKVKLATSDYYSSLKTYSGANIMPDVFYMQPKTITDFCRDGLLLNLSPYLEQGSDLTVDDLWFFNNSYKFNTETETLGSGDYYAFVKDFTPEFMMIYNKSHIDEYDQTHDKTLAEEVGYPTDDGKYPSATVSMSWAQSEKMCRLLSKFDASGNFIRYGTNVNHEPYVQFGQAVAQMGGTLYDEEGYFNASSSAVVAALNHLKNYMDGDTKSAAPIGSTTISDGQGFFNGDISVVFNGRWAFQQYDWMDADFEIGIAPPAMPEAGQDLTAVTAMVGIAASAETKYPAVAYKFIEYYMTYGQKLLSKKGFNIPGNKTIANKDYIDTGDQKIDELNKYFLSFVDKLEMSEINPWYDNTDNVFGTELYKAWATGSDRLSVEQALANAKLSLDSKVDQNKNRYGR